MKQLPRPIEEAATQNLDPKEQEIYQDCKWIFRAIKRGNLDTVDQRIACSLSRKYLQANCRLQRAPQLAFHLVQLLPPVTQSVFRNKIELRPWLFYNSDVLYKECLLFSLTLASKIDRTLQLMAFPRDSTGAVKLPIQIQEFSVIYTKLTFALDMLLRFILLEQL